MSIGIAVVLVATIFFMIVSPGFRLFAFLVLGAGAIGVPYLVNQSNEQARSYAAQNAERERVVTTTIRPDELLLTNVQLVRPSYDQYGTTLDEWLLTGEVTNNSSAPLETLVFDITVTDCARGPLQLARVGAGQRAASCNTVGQQRQVWVHVENRFSCSPYQPVVVPPGQTRKSGVVRFVSKDCPPHVPTANGGSRGT